jgi:hypothetical protein
MAKIRHFAALILLGLVTVGSTQITQAQNPSNYYVEDPRTFYGGLIGGLNFSQVDGDSYAGYHKVGFNAGGIVYVNLAENLASSLELLYSQKGSRGHQEQESGAHTLIREYKINLDYAEIAVQLNYFDKRKSHFGAGLSYSQLITAKETIVTDPVDPNIQNLELYPFKKGDLNFILGGNLKLWKGLFLNLRFQYSLIPIRKLTPPGYGRSEQYNNMWTVRLMYLF